MRSDELAEGGWYCHPRQLSGGAAGTNQSSSTSEEEEADEPWSVLRAATAGLQSPRFGGAPQAACLLCFLLKSRAGMCGPPAGRAAANTLV